jgi:glutamate racemase
MSSISTEKTIPQDSPILVFDSGVGGLSVLSEIRAKLPNAPVIYASDHAAMPYGERDEAELALRIPKLLINLVDRYRPRIAVIACNTACTIALEHIREALDIPVVGTVPAIKPAAEQTQTGVFGLLGTRATIRQHYVDKLEADFAQGKLLLRAATPELVTAAEAKLSGGDVDRAIVENSLRKLIDSHPNGNMLDIVILGCTHFPLLLEELQDAAKAMKLPQEIKFLDGAGAIARRVAALTDGQEWPSECAPGLMVTTASVEVLQPYLNSLKGFGLDSLHVIDAS